MWFSDEACGMTHKELSEEMSRRDFESALENLRESNPGQELEAEDVRELKSWLDKELEEIIVERR